MSTDTWWKQNKCMEISMILKSFVSWIIMSSKFFRGNGAEWNEMDCQVSRREFLKHAEDVFMTFKGFCVAVKELSL
jgi:hypothetical protein